MTTTAPWNDRVKRTHWILYFRFSKLHQTKYQNSFFFSKYNSQMCYEMSQHVNTRIFIRNSIERSDFGT